MIFRLVIILASISASVFAKSFEPARSIERAVPQYMKKQGIPGISVGLYYMGKPYFYNFGYADPQKKMPVTAHTIFEIGSITKSFTATILALEVNEGNMQLDDPLGAYIPMIRGHPLAHITLEQLATHTSSLPRKSPVPKVFMTKRRVLHALLGWRPELPLGSHYLYSNLGYNLLGYALEEETHRPYMALFNEYIIQPLQMKMTLLKVPRRLMAHYAQGHNKRGIPIPRMRVNALGAAGSLKSTSTDMMQFLMANLGAAGPQPLIEAMQLTHQGLFKATKKMTQGLSWQRVRYKGGELIDKNGGVTGFSTWIGFVPNDDPENKIGLLLLSNKRNKQLTGLGRRLLRELSSLAKNSIKEKA